MCVDDPDLCPGTEICAPVAPQVFELLETICIAIFTVDYVVRIGLVGLMPARLGRVMPPDWDDLNPDSAVEDPVFSYYYQTYRYASQYMNIIDLVAILPYYIGLGSGGGSGSVSIVRILRLARVLRVFKIGGFSSGMALIGRAITKSLPAIGILFFFTTLGVILFGSVIFFLESGAYVVSKDFPSGEYVRWNFNHSEKEKSPFVSILVSCYWAVVTSTTVGYGEMHPTSPMGRFVSVVLMYVGILVLALPISVIGAAFTKEYEKLHMADEEERSVVEDSPPLPPGEDVRGFGLEGGATQLLSLSYQEDKASIRDFSPIGGGTVNKRSKAEIRRELAFVSAKLRDLASTVTALAAELGDAASDATELVGGDSQDDDAISAHGLNPFDIDSNS